MTLEERVKELENWNREILRLLEARKESIKELENIIKELKDKLYKHWIDS